MKILNERKSGKMENIKYLIAIVVIFLNITAAFAQNQTSPAKASTPGASKVKPTTRESLDELFQVAFNDQLGLQTQLQQQMDPDNYNWCTVENINIQQEYVQWFLDRQNLIKNFLKKISLTNREVQMRMDEIKKLNIQVAPVPTLGTTPTSASLQDALALVNLLNRRLDRAMSAAEKVSIFAQAEKPINNRPQFALSQIKSAINTFKPNFEATLTEGSINPILKWEQTENAVRILVEVTYKLSSDEETHFGKSLIIKYDLSAVQNFTTDAEIAKALIMQNLVVDGQPFDAIKRYAAFDSKRTATCSGQSFVFPGMDTKPRIYNSISQFKFLKTSKDAAYSVGLVDISRGMVKKYNITLDAAYALNFPNHQFIFKLVNNSLKIELLDWPGIKQNTILDVEYFNGQLYFNSSSNVELYPTSPLNIIYLNNDMLCFAVNQPSVLRASETKTPTECLSNATLITKK